MICVRHIGKTQLVLTRIVRILIMINLIMIITTEQDNFRKQQGFEENKTWASTNAGRGCFRSEQPRRPP